MTAPSGRTPRGRRDNGLDAPGYVAAADVDPRVGEHLLDVLGLAGIAAYLVPTADLHPVTRTTLLPSRPMDRLWVDRDHLAEARAAVRRLESDRGRGDPGEQAMPTGGTGGTDRAGAAGAVGGEADDVEEQWRRIVDGFDAPQAGGPVPSWPAAEDADPVPGPSSDAPDPADTADAERSGWARPAGGLRAGSRAAPRAGDDEDGSADEGTDPDTDGYGERGDADDEGYDPPPPPPLPRASRHTVLALVGIVLGLALFFRPSLLSLRTEVTLVLGVLGILGGAAVLVGRLRDGVPADDDPDDGAVV